MSEGTQVRRHIALLLPSLAIGGAERSLLTLARAWCDMGMQVDVVTVLDGGGLRGELPAAVRHIPLVRQVTMRSPLRAGLTALRGLVNYLHREQPDALLSSVTGANLLAVAARPLSGVSCRVVLREACVARNTTGMARRWAVSLFYRHADAVVAVAGGVAQDLVSVFSVPAGRVHPLPSPIDLARVQILAREVPIHPWCVRSDRPLIVTAGRLVAQKDHGMLIRAVAGVRVRRPVRLLILGEGPERPALEALVEELGLGEAVAMPGALPNPYPCMASGQVFALSSRWEGMPVALIEAMALGTPVVATDCHSGPRELLHGGALGALVPVGDSVAMADAIERTLDSPPNTDALRVRAGDFEAGHCARAYLEVLLGRSEGVA